MVEKNSSYWSQELKRRLDRVTTVKLTPRFDKAAPSTAVLYKAVVSLKGTEKEIAWNMTCDEAGLLVGHLRRKIELKNVGTDGESYFEFVPEYRIEKQKETAI